MTTADPHCARRFGLALALALALPPLAQASGGHSAHGAHAAPVRTQAAAPELTDGEVRKVDRENGRVTLRHAEIKSLDMPPMTMVFAVRDRALLDGLKTGDRVRFKAVGEGGTFTVTEIEALR
jgi:Cu(I)/Ag(I) efflux system protein CusF